MLYSMPSSCPVARTADVLDEMILFPAFVVLFQVRQQALHEVVVGWTRCTAHTASASQVL